MIVDDDGKMVRWKSVRLDQHLVVHVLVRNRQIAVNEIVQRRLAIERHGEPHDLRIAGARVRGAFCRRQEPALAIVPRRRAARLLLLAHLLQALRRTVAIVRVTGREQALNIFRIDRQALRLNVRSVRAADVRSLVPVQAEEAQRVHNQFQSVLDFAFLIGVFDAQDELAAGVPRPQPDEQRGTQTADVRRAGGAGRKADAHFRHA